MQTAVVLCHTPKGGHVEIAVADVSAIASNEVPDSVAGFVVTWPEDTSLVYLRNGHILIVKNDGCLENLRQKLHGADQPVAASEPRVL